MKKQKPWSTNKSMSFQLFKKKKQTHLNFFQYVIEPISHDLEKLVCFFFFLNKYTSGLGGLCLSYSLLCLE